MPGRKKSEPELDRAEAAEEVVATEQPAAEEKPKRTRRKKTEAAAAETDAAAEVKPKRTRRKKTDEEPAADAAEKPKRTRRKKADAEPAAAEKASDDTFSYKYDVSSDKRYVDLTSQKSDFDKILDELSGISKDTILADVKRLTEEFKIDEDGEEEKAKKFDALFGGFISNAAMELYDMGYVDMAFQRLEQTKNILEAKRKLETELAAIKAKHEEHDLDLFGDMGLFGGDDSGN